MMNTPTNSAMPANTNRLMVRNFRLSLISCELVLAAWAPVLASNPVGRTCWTRSRSTDGDTPGSAATPSESY